MLNLCAPIYVLLMIIEAHGIVAEPPVFYFLGENGNQMNTTDINDIYGKNLSKLVIALDGLYHVDAVGKSPTESTAEEVLTYYDDGSESHTYPCLWDKEFHCGKPSRMIIVNLSNNLKELNITMRDTNLDEYVGCFDKQLVPVTNTASNLDFCKIDCRKAPFYGINPMHQCVCIYDISKLLAVDVGLCNKTLNRHQIYGGKNHFSVYSKTKVPRSVVYPSWECIYNLNFEKCPKCPEGRKGIDCEVIVCAVGNGSCGNEKECQSTILWTYVVVAVCTCKAGIQMNNDFSCGAKDDLIEEDFQGWSKMYALYIAILVLIALFTGTYAYDIHKSEGIFSPKDRSEESVKGEVGNV